VTSRNWAARDQVSNTVTCGLAKMNIAIRRIYPQIARRNTFHNNRHADLNSDNVLANPPFNDSDLRGQLLKDDSRWADTAPPAGNPDFALVWAAARC
jgi:type I restriction enzyme M protein